MNFWLEGSDEIISLKAKHEEGATQNLIDIQWGDGQPKFVLREVHCEHLCSALGIVKGDLPQLALRDDRGGVSTLYMPHVVDAKEPRR